MPTLPWKRLLAVTGVILLFAALAPGQQKDIPRFDAFLGYAFLNSPHVNLFENGAAAQVGVRVKRWMSLGVDYTIAQGTLNLTPDMLTDELHTSLGTQLANMVKAGLIPASYSLVVPAHSLTQTLAVGPQVSYRRFTRTTIFARPLFLGLMHEAAKPRPTDPIAQAIAKGLAPSGVKTDNVPFIGFGGGFDLIVNRTFSWRTQADLVYDHLFSDTLRDGRFTVRFSTGPAFNFGKNIAK